MSDIVQKITWENFCNKENETKIDKDVDRLVHFYENLLDLRNLNSKDVGPSLTDLPKDCLSILTKRCQYVLECMEDNENQTTRALGFVKLLCIIGRNPENLSVFSSNDIKSLIYRFIEVALEKQTSKIDGEWLKLYEYLLFFLEITYDSTFCWRRRKQLYFCDEWSPNKVPQSNTLNSITSETIAWVHENLTKHYNDDDARNRLLHLCSCIACGSRDNAMFLVSPAIMDTINLNHDNVTNETVMSYASLVICLAEVPQSERQEDLQDTVGKLMHYFERKSDIRMPDLRILNQLVTSSEELTLHILSVTSTDTSHTHRYQSVALYNVLNRILTHTINSSVSDDDNKQGNQEIYVDTCKLIFRLLASITCYNHGSDVDLSHVCTVQCTNIRSIFQETGGYQCIIDCLLGAPIQPDFLLDIVFSWAVNCEFDAAKLDLIPYRIRDGDVINLLVEWASLLAIKYYEKINNEYNTILSDVNNNDNTNTANITTQNSTTTPNIPIVNWKAIFKLIMELCHTNFSSASQKTGYQHNNKTNWNFSFSRYSITECCNSHIVQCICKYIEFSCGQYDEAKPEVIDYTDEKQCERLNRIERIFQDLLINLFQLFRMFLGHSVAREDMMAVLHLFKDKHSQKRGKYIIKLLIDLIDECHLYNIDHWFEFSQPGDSISFQTIKYDYVSPNHKRNSNSNINERKMSSPLKTAGEPTFKLSNSGFTFNTWINIDPISLDSRAAFERRCIFRILSSGSNGFEAFLDGEGQLTLATCHQGEFYYSIVSLNSASNKSKAASSTTSSKQLHTMLQKPLLTANKWHMLTIVYQNAKSIFSKSIATVYLDGVCVANTDLKYPSGCHNEDVRLLHICGCPPNLRIDSSSSTSHFNNLQLTPPSSHKYNHNNSAQTHNRLVSLPSPVATTGSFVLGFFQSSSGNSSSSGNTNNTNMKTILGDESRIWGRLVTLKGRVVSAFCIGEVLSEQTIMNMYDKGPMKHQGGLACLDDNILNNSLIFGCHSIVFDPKNASCINLMPSILASKQQLPPQNHSNNHSKTIDIKYGNGVLKGFWLERNRFEKVIIEVGGIASLLLLMEQLESMNTDDSSWLGGITPSSSLDDWIMDTKDSSDTNRYYVNQISVNSGATGAGMSLSSQESSNENFVKITNEPMNDKLISESILASIFILMRKLCYTSDVQVQIDRSKCIPIIGALMQKIDPILLDKNVLIALHALADPHCTGSSYITRHIYQFILLDWRIWNRSSLAMRKEHVKFLLDLVEHEKTLFRTDFSISYFLDVIRIYHSPESVDNNDDVYKEIREVLFSIIFSLVHRHPSIHDYQQIVRFIHECTDDSPIQEAINLLTDLFVYVSNKSDNNSNNMLLIYDKYLMESLFVLLVRPLTDHTKESAVKYLHSIITSTKVPDKLKNNLLLDDVSFAGIFICREFYRSVLSPVTIQHILNILKKVACKDLFGVVQFLSLLTLSPSDQRIHAMKMVQSFFDKSQEALVAISKQPGWQDILIHLLVLSKREDYDQVLQKSVTCNSSSRNSPGRESTNNQQNTNNNNVNTETDLKYNNPSCNSSDSDNFGFRRTSAWAIDDSTSTDNYSVSKFKFDEIPEEIDEDETLLENVIRKDLEEGDSSAEIKSVETMYFNEQKQQQQQQYSIPNNKLTKCHKPLSTSINETQWANNTISLGYGRLGSISMTTPLKTSNELISRRNTGASCSSGEQDQKLKVSVIYDMEGRQIEHEGDLWEEELCKLVLECITRSVWCQAVQIEDMNGSNGPAGDSCSDFSSWKSVHEVMESLNSVNERYILMKPVFYFKQQIIMRLLDSLIKYMGREGVSTKKKVNHAIELIQLTVDMTSQYSVQNVQEKYDLQLLDQIMTLLQDYLMVWEDDAFTPANANPDTQFMDPIKSGVLADEQAELKGLGFYYLLTLLNDDDMSIVAAVSARLLQVLTCVSRNMGYEEVAFIIVHLDSIMREKIESENYFFLAPILKTILESHYDLLQVAEKLPNISLRTAEFFDDFKSYCQLDEWKLFVKDRLYSGCEIYQTTFLNRMATVQSLWRAQANEQMSKDRKERHSLSIVEKKKFEKLYVFGMSFRWCREEKRRRDWLVKEMASQYDAIMKWWKKLLKGTLLTVNPYWNDERDEDGISERMYWRQSWRENSLRMRPRFEPNLNFDPHKQASRERDNPNVWLKRGRENIIEDEESDHRDDPMLYLGIGSADRGEDMLGDEDWVYIQDIQANNIEQTQLSASTASSASSASSLYASLSSAKKSSLFESPCTLVVVNEVVEGVFKLTNSHFYFKANVNNSINNYEITTSQLTYSINQIREVHLRRYNLRRSAIEIFLTDQTNFFFNFNAKNRNKVYSKILSLRPPNLMYSKQRSPADLLKSSNLTQKWMNREISNFEYLMHLNTIAGRTFNDLSQYPVFPWIISNYTSPKLDLNDPATFRDLSKPIGVVNPKNEKDVREKFENFEDPNGVIKKFHYGTHYSSAAGVMHYLVRTEPFTTMHVQLQSGKFDVADRQFYSIPLAWSFIWESANDNKELIPEFFYHSNFLRNENDFNFGTLQQQKTPIDDVELPMWANSPEDFIYQHRQALECEFVSQNLHHWIDLIFGYKQKGYEAEKALNVFYYVTYEGCVDLDQIEDPCERESLESMINNFGQTPCQLLKTPHPRRYTEFEVLSQILKADKCLPVLSHLPNLRHCSKVISSHLEPICCVRVPSIIPKNLIGGDSKSIPLVTVHTSNIFARHTWYPSVKASLSNSFNLEVDPILESQPQFRRRKFIGAQSERIKDGNHQHKQQLYALSPNGQFLVCGGDPENRLTIVLWRTSKRRGTTVTSTSSSSSSTLSSGVIEICRIASPHVEPICCVAMDTDGALSLGNAGKWSTNSSTVSGSGNTNATNSASINTANSIDHLHYSNGGNGSPNTAGIINDEPELIGNGVRIQGVTGGLDGLVVVWDWSLVGADLPNNPTTINNLNGNNESNYSNTNGYGDNYIGATTSGNTGYITSSMVDMATRVLLGVIGEVGSVSMSAYLDLVAAGGAQDRSLCVWSLSGAYLMHKIVLGGIILKSPPISPNVQFHQQHFSFNKNPQTNQTNDKPMNRGGVSHVVMTADGIYVSWWRHQKPSIHQRSKMTNPNQSRPITNYLTSLSLHATHRATLELDQPSPSQAQAHRCTCFVTTLQVATPPSSSSNIVILGCSSGDLHFLEGHTLSHITVLRFSHTILDVQLVSTNGQHLLVALSDGSVILSTVNLTAVSSS